MRQVHYSTADQRVIDLVLFVNGLPVATIELKTDFTQSIDDAIDAVPKDRHPRTRTAGRAAARRSGTARWCTSRSPTTRSR